MKNTVLTFKQAKEKGEKLSMLTAYDYSDSIVLTFPITFLQFSGNPCPDSFSLQALTILFHRIYPISIHPMFAFSDRESVYQQLNQVSFTLEGESHAVSRWKEIFEALGKTEIPRLFFRKPAFR